MLRLLDVEQSYLQEKSYVATAQKLHVSKQRIEQILRRSNNPAVLALRNTKRQKNFTPSCLTCHRLFSLPHIRHITGGLCSACYSFSRRENHARVRFIFYPKLCVLCKEETQKNMRCQNMCLRCYNKTVTRNSPRYKERYTAYNHKNKERLNIQSRKRYYENIKYYRSYARQWYKIRSKRNPVYWRAYYYANREKILAIQKAYRERKKLAL